MYFDCDILDIESHLRNNKLLEYPSGQVIEHCYPS